jgi:hypothetical protein
MVSVVKVTRARVTCRANRPKPRVSALKPNRWSVVGIRWLQTDTTVAPLYYAVVSREDRVLSYLWKSKIKQFQRRCASPTHPGHQCI